MEYSHSMMFEIILLKFWSNIYVQRYPNDIMMYKS